MALRLYDSLSGRVHDVRPRPRRPLTLYVCGPTVYDRAHVGHARTYLTFDLVRRTLAARAVPVRHVMNITDVEDKITDRARALHVGWRELARREERGFLTDLAAAGMLRADATPRASAYVARMVEVARALDRTGRVRRTEEGWSYRPDPRHARANFPGSTALRRHAVPERGHPFRAGERDVTADEYLIWKPQAPPGPGFPSPWGRGVPGWHLECYTMAKDLLGIPVDLHGGGRDLLFPHHFAENETALALDGDPFARTFLHSAFVTADDGLKMSKSTGNLVPLNGAIAAYGADALRWYLLSTPITLPLPWEASAAENARAELEEIRASVGASLAAGAGGSMPGARYARLYAAVLARLERGLHGDAALGEMRSFAASLGARSNARVGRGERRAALAALARTESLLGIRLH